MDFLEYLKTEGIPSEAMQKLAEAHKLFQEAMDLMLMTAAREPGESVSAAIMAQLVEGLAERSTLETRISYQAAVQATKALEERIRALESRLSE